MGRGGLGNPGHRAVVSTAPATGRSRRSSLVPVAFAWLLAACGTTYQPSRPGRISVGIHHGAPAYRMDGHEVPIGPLSGRLEGLVADVPAAAAHAHTAHHEFMVGVPAYLTGLGGVVLGIVLLSGPIGWAVIGIGGAAAGTGLGLMGAGVTHALDAVNIHNDHSAAPDLSPARNRSGQAPGQGDGDAAAGAGGGPPRVGP